MEGKKDDKNKLKWDLLPIESLLEVVKVLNVGAEKYDHKEIFKKHPTIDIKVSDLGRIVRCDNSKEIPQWSNKWGYKLVTIPKKLNKGVRKHKQVHRLVMETFVGFSDLKGANENFSARAEFETDKELLESKVSESLNKVTQNVYDIEETMNKIVGDWIKEFEKRFTALISKNFIQYISTNYPDTVIKEVSIEKDGSYEPSFDFDKAYFSIVFSAKGE